MKKTATITTNICGVTLTIPAGQQLPTRKADGAYPGKKITSVEALQAYNVALPGSIRPMLVEMDPRFRALGWTYADMKELGHIPKSISFKKPESTTSRPPIHKIPGTNASITIGLHIGLHIPPITVRRASDIDDLVDCLCAGSLGVYTHETQVYIQRLVTKRKTLADSKPVDFVWELIKFPGKDGREDNKLVLSHVGGTRVCDLPTIWKEKEALRALIGPAGFTEFCDIATGPSVETTRISCNGHM